MKRVTLSLVTLLSTFLFFNLAFAQLANTPWPMLGHDARHTSRSPYVGPQTNNLIWKTFVGYSDSASPVIGSDGTIYIATWEFQLYAINPDGTIKWTWYIPSPHTTSCSTAAIGTDGTIYFSVYDGYIYALNPDGTLRWKYYIGRVTLDYPPSSPVIDASGTIYVGSYETHPDYASEGNFFGFNPNGSCLYQISIESTGCSPAIGIDETILTAAGSGNSHIVYAFTPELNLKWNYTTASNVREPVIADDGTIYITNSAGILALNQNGTMKWASGLKTTQNTVPSIGQDGTLYFGTDDSNLYALNPDGSMKWSFVTDGVLAEKATPTIGADGLIYIGTVRGVIQVINPDGSKKWSYDLPHAENIDFYSQPSIGSDGSLYIVSHDGYLYAFKDNEIPTQTSVKIYTFKPTYTAGDNLKIEAKIDNAENDSIDFFAAALIDGHIYCYPGWNNELKPTVINETTITKEILNLILPENSPAGTYTFFAMITKHSSFDLLGFDHITVQIE